MGVRIHKNIFLKNVLLNQWVILF